MRFLFRDFYPFPSQCVNAGIGEAESVFVIFHMALAGEMAGAFQAENPQFIFDYSGDFLYSGSADHGGFDIAAGVAI